MKGQVRKMQKGFTLIEFTIVVAIIGVLSAIAIPAYQDYVKKSEASSGLATIKALVTPAELFIQETGPLTGVGDLNTTATANSLGSITTAADSITFTFNNTSSINGATLVLTRNAATGWSCANTGAPAIDGCI